VSDLYQEGYDHGIAEPTRTNGEIHADITSLTKQIRDLMTADGFDADAADTVVYNAGYIAALADRINL
jgi:hypothetical protein